MGWYCHVSTCFSLDYDGCVPRKAKAYSEREDITIQSKHMFEEMSEGKGFFIGCKGTLFNWGYVGNYVEIEPFIETLKQFLEEVRSLFTEGFLAFDHAIVFYEQEQSNMAIAYEIMPKDDDPENELVVRKHDCPFCWNQY